MFVFFVLAYMFLVRGVQKRKDKKIQINAAEALLDVSELPSSITDSTESVAENEGADITLDNIRRQEYQRLLSENLALKQRMNDLEIHERSFKDNGTKCAFIQVYLAFLRS